MDHNYDNKHKTLSTHCTGSPSRNHQQDSKKQTIFHNNDDTTNIDTPQDTTTRETMRANTAQIHTQIVANYMQTIPHNKILNRTLPISNNEQALTHYTTRLLAQLRTNKSPILHEYLHKITPETHPTPNCRSPMPHSTTQHATHIWLPKVADGPGPRGAMGRSRGAAGLLTRWSDELGWGLERG